MTYSVVYKILLASSSSVYMLFITYNISNTSFQISSASVHLIVLPLDSESNNKPAKTLSKWTKELLTSSSF